MTPTIKEHLLKNLRNSIIGACGSPQAPMAVTFERIYPTIVELVMQADDPDAALSAKTSNVRRSEPHSEEKSEKVVWNCVYGHWLLGVSEMEDTL